MLFRRQDNTVILQPFRHVAWNRPFGIVWIRLRISTALICLPMLVETDLTAGVHPPHHLAQYDVWRSNQHLEVAQGSQFVDNFFNHGVPVSHVSFYGVLGEFHAPETADTLSLLVIGIGVVFLFRFWRSKPAWR